MSKFWRKNKAVILTSTVGVLALAGFLGLGYAYSTSAIGTDVVGVGVQVSNLRYFGGTGSVYQVTTNLVEAPLTTSTDFSNLQAKIDEKLIAESTDGLVTEEQYVIAATEILQELAGIYNEDPEAPEFKDDLNINEQSLVVLANSGQEGLDYSAQMLRHFMPVTYIGDDANENVSDVETGVMKYNPEGTKYNAYTFGAVNTIYTNPENDVYRFRIRDGSDDKAAALWENGEYIEAEDIAFAISKNIPSLYASSTAYMLSPSIANIKNVDNALTVDKVLDNEDPGRWEGTEFGGSWTDEREPTDAMYFGWAPNDTYTINEGEENEYTIDFTRESVLDRDETFVSFDDSVANVDAETDNTGIVFYDPERDANGEIINEGEYSYIEFRLNAPSKTFPTQLSSVSYWPLNVDWYMNKFGWVHDINGFGVNADTFLSSGGFNLVRFDNLYGIDAKKSDTYWDKELVTADSYTYRMVSEAATQAAMFQTGQASFIRGDNANSKVLASDPNTKEWMNYSGKTVSPRSQYMFWNFRTNKGSDGIDGGKGTTTATQFYKDPNFRRAVGNMYNPNVFHKLSGVDSAQAVNMFTPMGFLKDAANNDLVDYGKNTLLETSASQALGIEGERIEYYGVDERLEAIKNPLNDEQLSSTVLTRYNEEISNYYFSVFVDDMEQILGSEWDETWEKGPDGNSKELDIKVLVKPGVEDSYLKSLQASFGVREDGNRFGFKPYELDADGNIVTKSGERVYKNTTYYLNFVARPSTSSSSYISDAVSGSDYDIANISWGADYYDVWSTLGIFNKYETGRGSNLAGYWSYWDGADMSFDTDDYKGNGQLARELFNDGLTQFYDNDDGNENIKGATIDFDGSVLEEGGIPGAETIDLKVIGEDLWTRVLADNGQSTSWVNTEERKLLTEGLIYGNHVGDFWGTKANEIGAYLLMEVLIYDSGAGYIGTTESGSITPSRMLLDGDPVLGYANRSFGFDVTRIPNGTIWKDVEKELLALTPAGK